MNLRNSSKVANPSPVKTPRPLLATLSSVHDDNNIENRDESLSRTPFRLTTKRSNDLTDSLLEKENSPNPRRSAKNRNSEKKGKVKLIRRNKVVLSSKLSREIRNLTVDDDDEDDDDQQLEEEKDSEDENGPDSFVQTKKTPQLRRSGRRRSSRVDKSAEISQLLSRLDKDEDDDDDEDEEYDSVAAEVMPLRTKGKKSLRRRVKSTKVNESRVKSVLAAGIDNDSNAWLNEDSVENMNKEANPKQKNLRKRKPQTITKARISLPNTEEEENIIASFEENRSATKKKTKVIRRTDVRSKVKSDVVAERCALEINESVETSKEDATLIRKSVPVPMITDNNFPDDSEITFQPNVESTRLHLRQSLGPIFSTPMTKDSLQGKRIINKTVFDGGTQTTPSVAANGNISVVSRITTTDTCVQVTPSLFDNKPSSSDKVVLESVHEREEEEEDDEGGNYDDDDDDDDDDDHNKSGFNNEKSVEPRQEMIERRMMVEESGREILANQSEKELDNQEEVDTNEEEDANEDQRGDMDEERKETDEEENDEQEEEEEEEVNQEQEERNEGDMDEEQCGTEGEEVDEEEQIETEEEGQVSEEEEEERRRKKGLSSSVFKRRYGVRGKDDTTRYEESFLNGKRGQRRPPSKKIKGKHQSRQTVFSNKEVLTAFGNFTSIPLNQSGRDEILKISKELTKDILTRLSRVAWYDGGRETAYLADAKRVMQQIQLIPVNDPKHLHLYHNIRQVADVKTREKLLPMASWDGKYGMSAPADQWDVIPEMEEQDIVERRKRKKRRNRKNE